MQAMALSLLEHPQLAEAAQRGPHDHVSKDFAKKVTRVEPGELVGLSQKMGEGVSSRVWGHC